MVYVFGEDQIVHYDKERIFFSFIKYKVRWLVPDPIFHHPASVYLT